AVLLPTPVAALASWLPSCSWLVPLDSPRPAVVSRARPRGPARSACGARRGDRAPVRRDDHPRPRLLPRLGAGPDGPPPPRLARLSDAVLSASKGLEESQQALSLDPEVGSIFEVHRILLEGVRPELEDTIRKGVSAEHAVASVLRRYANRLAELSDPMFAERRQDVLDVERRLLRALAGRAEPRLPGGDARSPVVVVAEDLTPTEAAALSGAHVAGLVLE